MRKIYGYYWQFYFTGRSLEGSHGPREACR